MNKQNILILGGAGYIGTVLCSSLRQAGYVVTAADQCWFGNHLEPGITLLHTDIFALKPADLEPYDAVVFLAGLSNDPMAEFSPKDNFIYNTALPAYIGYIAREAGVKHFMFASSCSVYGYTGNQTYTETDPTVCNYPYGISKLQGEQSLLALADENFSVTCFRQGTVSGYSPRMRLDLAINTMFRYAVQKGEIILSNHKIWRPILGLGDLCSAYSLALAARPAGGTVFNISSFNATVGDLARHVAAFVQQQYGHRVAITDRNVQDYRNYKVSVEKATALLHYKPEQQVTDIIRDLHQHLDDFRNFDNARYSNIEVFKNLVLSQPLMA